MPPGTYIRTEEFRKKISELRKGCPPTMLGKHLTEEQRRKVSEARRGKPLSEEHRKKLSIILKLNPPWLGKHRSEDTKRKLAEANIGKTPTEETRRKMSESRRGKPSHRKGKHLSDEHVKNWFKAVEVKPNKMEQTLLALLNRISLKWCYVGNGELIIGGKCPDFWNGDHKLIELFGDYWHSEAVRGYTKEEGERQRISYFNQYGYECLVIWEHELKDEGIVLDKIQTFAG